MYGSYYCMRCSLSTPIKDNRHEDICDWEAPQTYVYSKCFFFIRDICKCRVFKENYRTILFFLFQDEKIYDIPCDPSRSPSPEFHTSTRTRNFESLRQSFEQGFQNQNTVKAKFQKPPFPKAPSDSKLKTASSTDSLSEEFKAAKKSIEKKFATEIKKPRRYERNIAPSSGFTLNIGKKKNQQQLDVDRENVSFIFF